MTKTKAQLELELKEANREIDSLRKELAKKEDKKASYTYLYTAIDMTTDYLKSILAKTNLLRTIATNMPDRKIEVQSRLFHDGNKVEIRHTVYNDAKRKPEVMLIFYKKDVVVGAK